MPPCGRNKFSLLLQKTYSINFPESIVISHIEYASLTIRVEKLRLNINWSLYPLSMEFTLLQLYSVDLRIVLILSNSISLKVGANMRYEIFYFMLLIFISILVIWINTKMTLIYETNFPTVLTAQEIWVNSHFFNSLLLCKVYNIILYLFNYFTWVDIIEYIY